MSSVSMNWLFRSQDSVFYQKIFIQVFSFCYQWNEEISLLVWLRCLVFLEKVIRLIGFGMVLMKSLISMRRLLRSIFQYFLCKRIDLNPSAGPSSLLNSISTPNSHISSNRSRTIIIERDSLTRQIEIFSFDHISYVNTIE
jgi:hypothetical protein